MEFLALLAFALFGLHLLRSREQHRRIALLSSTLGKYQIEQLMENLTEGYMRWLDEKDPERRTQVWGVLQGTEQALAHQFQSFAADFAALEAPLTQVSKLPFTPPFAQPLLPAYRLFDARKVFAVHARGIEACADNSAGLPDKDRAFMMTAELYLMQHTCHWFCRSKGIATARLLARHQTHYQQVVDSVSSRTRNDYLALVR